MPDDVCAEARAAPPAGGKPAGAGLLLNAERSGPAPLPAVRAAGTRVRDAEARGLGVGGTVLPCDKTKVQATLGG